MAQSLLQSGAVNLTGTDLIVAQVSAFIESVEKQLRTNSYDPLAVETTIAPENWSILNAQILNSQTLKNKWKSDWCNEWDVDTLTLPQQQDVPLPRNSGSKI